MRLPSRRWSGVLVSCALALAGCEEKGAEPAKPAEPDCTTTVDRTQLQAVVQCYYSAVLKTGTGYDLLSKESKASNSPEKFQQNTKDGQRGIAAFRPEVIGEEDRGGKHFARVSVDMALNPPARCASTVTHTWVREDGKWARVVAWDLQEKAKHLSAEKKHDEALAEIGHWLEREPYNTQAYDMMIGNLDALGPTATPAQKEQRASAEKAQLAINPKDTLALTDGIRATDNKETAKSLFAKLPLNTCHRPEAAALIVHKLTDPQEQLAFLDAANVDDPYLLVARLEALTKLNKRDAALALLTPEITPRLQNVFTLNAPPAYAAEKAAFIGTQYLEAGQFAQARQWLDVGTRRNPESQELKALAAALAQKQPAGAAGSPDAGTGAAPSAGK